MDRCIICEEEIKDTDEAAEMHDPRLSDPELYSEAETGLVHAQCGMDKGWEVS